MCGGSWCLDPSLSPFLVKFTQILESILLDNPHKAAVLSVGCASFSSTLFPSTQLSVNMLGYSTLWPSHRPSTNSLLVSTGTRGEYNAAGDSQAAVPFPTGFLNRRDFDLQWKIASSLSYLLLQLGSNNGEASLPEKAPPGVRLLHPVWLRGVLEELHQGSPSGELTGGGKRRSHPRVRRNGAASVTLASSSTTYLLPNTREETGSTQRRFSVCRPARSSADVCQRGAVCQCIGGGNTPCGVSPHPQGAQLALGLVLSSGPTSAWRQPSLSANLCSKLKLLRASEALTDSSSSTGPLCSPARTIERSQEGTRGGLGGCNLLAPLRNLTMRSCFPRNRPSTASWCAVIAATCLCEKAHWGKHILA